MAGTRRSQPCWQPCSPVACASGHQSQCSMHAAWCSCVAEHQRWADMGVQQRALSTLGMGGAPCLTGRTRAWCRPRTARSRCSQTAPASATSCWHAATARTWARGRSSCASHQALPAPAPRAGARRAAACGAGRAARAACMRARPARPARASAARQRPPRAIGVGQIGTSARAALGRGGADRHVSACSTWQG